MKLKSCIAAFAVAMLPAMASAATIMSDGVVYDITSDDEFNFTGYTSDKDAADDMFTFGFMSGGATGATSFSVSLDGVNPDLESLTATWSSEINGGGTIYNTETVAVTGPVASILSFGTDFSIGDPQWLTVSWMGESDEDNALISVEVAAVPVPAAGFLLLGGLGGIAALKRRRKAA